MRVASAAGARRVALAVAAARRSDGTRRSPRTLRCRLRLRRGRRTQALRRGCARRSRRSMPGGSRTAALTSPAPHVGPQARKRAAWFGCRDVYAYRGYNHFAGYNLFRYYQQVSWCSNGYSIYSWSRFRWRGVELSRLGLRRSHSIPTWAARRTHKRACTQGALPHVLRRVVATTRCRGSTSTSTRAAIGRRTREVDAWPRGPSRSIVRGRRSAATSLMHRRSVFGAAARTSGERNRAISEPTEHPPSARSPLDSFRGLGARLHARGPEDPGRVPLRRRLVGDPGRAAAARGRGPARALGPPAARVRLADAARPRAPPWPGAARRRAPAVGPARLAYARARVAA